MKYLLDTNICIYIIKRKPAIVLEKFGELPLGSVAISTITLAELEYGIRKVPIQTKIQKHLTSS